ncbi:FHA domain-containing protein [Amycolatopsis cihanbeyliensis]|uniref:Type III secretion system (T3SS) inner membrane Yop/YscD-like protein n=1 Tax=Amycolatopsis cihanbeyliensis TaxID=1128664 RepID=A0A542CTF6_AMYCI|nr:FHA domain-containing protein [Amycolatopsis cihanbeyliensis]TQI94074.1 type III secretion system (T3SS) inner membrane Yop/YscD-like protein [Amycolatopsis cihanbeyliensis]
MIVDGKYKLPVPEPRPEFQPTSAEFVPFAPGSPTGDDYLPAGPDAIGLPLLEVVRGPRTGARFSLPPGVTVIGRGPDSDIQLDDTTVSRRHVEFRRTGDRVVLHDAGSLNGTYLNREPVTQAELADGDEIWAGKFHLRYRGR